MRERITPSADIPFKAVSKMFIVSDEEFGAATARDARARALLDAGVCSDHLALYRLFLLWHSSAKPMAFGDNVSVSFKVAGQSMAVSLSSAGTGPAPGKAGGGDRGDGVASLLSSIGLGYDDFSDLGYPPVDLGTIRPFVSVKRMQEFHTLLVRSRPAPESKSHASHSPPPALLTKRWAARLPPGNC